MPFAEVLSPSALEEAAAESRSEVEEFWLLERFGGGLRVFVVAGGEAAAAALESVMDTRLCERMSEQRSEFRRDRMW